DGESAAAVAAEDADREQVFARREVHLGHALDRVRPSETAAVEDAHAVEEGDEARSSFAADAQKEAVPSGRLHHGEGVEEVPVAGEVGEGELSERCGKDAPGLAVDRAALEGRPIEAEFEEGMRADRTDDA